MRAYGGVLFRPGDANSPDPVARALHILEHAVPVGDATIYYVLRKLLRGPLPVMQGTVRRPSWKGRSITPTFAPSSSA